MTTTNQLEPLNTQDRIAYLDILRGIAILFIFTANIVFFSGYFSLSPEQIEAFPTAKIDEYLDFIMFTLVDGKFYSIFSLLFGIGFVVQYNNLKKHNKEFVPFFGRRMFWLLIIGLCHIFFLWLGDILTLYALLGFVLILFRNCSNKKLLIWSIILILLPIFHRLLLNLTGWYYPREFFKLYSAYWEYLELPIRDFGNGMVRPDNSYYFESSSFVEFFKINLGRPLIRFANILNEGRAFKVLGIFLIGVWSGRKILNENILSNTPLFKKIFIWGFIIGLPVSIFRTVIEFFLDRSLFWEFMNNITYAFGTVPLAMSYAALIALICSKNANKLKWFAPVGRMALSNYIFQTIISITIFYGIGFGFHGQFSFVSIMGIALFIFIIQSIFSYWWLSKYKYGPLEWIWRQLTYGKRIHLKK